MAEQAIRDLQAQLAAVQLELSGRSAIDEQLRLLAAAQAGGGGLGGGASRGSGQGGVDTKLLGRPDVLLREEQWTDWATVMRAYASLLCAPMQPAMEEAELGWNVSLAATADDDTKAAARALHYTLTMLCRGEALAIIQNAGRGEGFLAWQKLCARYEPGNRTRVAGMLAALMRFSFTGDIQSRMELFERQIGIWEKKAGERLSDQVRIGMVLNSLEDNTTLKDHLVMNSSRFTTWLEL